MTAIRMNIMIKVLGCHQVGSKDSGRQNFTFLGLKAWAEGEVQILHAATATARDRRNKNYR
jgi:hypothetical protein